MQITCNKDGSHTITQYTGEDAVQQTVPAGEDVNDAAVAFREKYPDEVIEAPPDYLVPKSVIIDRLHEAGKLEAARVALDSATLYTQERWNSRNAIYGQDETARALIKAIGADADAILAPV